MDKNIAIKIEAVSKKYCRALPRSMSYGICDIARNMCGLPSHAHILRKDEFWAIEDVSFEVERGETVGVIGPNGSGKTTLLKMLNGVLLPDKGLISVRGSVGALIEVGIGFHPLLTGRENIYIYAAIMGMDRKEVNEKFDEITAFAEIDDFLDVPVKHYSSGMFVRLGFSVAVHCDPDILLIDEILAVGDMSFQNKCINRIRELQKKKKTIIFVSHNLVSVESLCSRALWLQNGKINFLGHTKASIKEYTVQTNMSLAKKKQIASRRHSDNAGQAHITGIQLINKQGVPREEFYTGEEMRIRVDYAVERDISIEKPTFAVVVHDMNGIRVFISNTKILRCSPSHIRGNGSITCIIPSLSLLPDVYYIDVYINDEMNLINYDVVSPGVYFTVIPSIRDEELLRMSGKMGLMLVQTEWRY